MSRAATPRRWPDIMIGTLVLLLLGGFGTLLLRPQATTPVSTPSEAATTTTPAIPGAPGTSEVTGTETVSTTPITPAPSDPVASTTPADTASAAAEPTTPDSEAAPVIAAAPIGTPDPTLTSPAESATSTADESATTDPATPADAAPATPAARTGGAVPTSEQRTPLRSDYRITLGTFSSVEAAQQAAQGVSALGYTVYPIDLGTQVVAQVGPFTDETTARQALTDVQRAAPGAVLYPPRGTSLGSPAAAPAATPTTDTPPTEATTPAAAPTSNTPTYLQVGAFDRLDSAQNLVQQLRDLGYNPTVNAPAGKKVTVLVGPYTGDPLTRTETRLQENGLDSFRVR
ncbi:SPOR domain-containing protein [Deinococcus sedimenti]|uniref:SPOR domain-containing protein n=1 Tax=Deinococcus sedimenti TaxID=1867090 RepID=A0ABQ2S0X0_9DEIO|nr:SPOR domain-containing protein [Deinococcus sedimenti]GGR80967.1 hypothetical protein GCM10008960_04820 [Deinococcus sedimenti]